MDYKTLNYNGTEITLRISSYCNNNRIAIAMYELWEGHHEQYGVATVNLDDFLRVIGFDEEQQSPAAKTNN
jgi:hypothetical protein